MNCSPRPTAEVIPLFDSFFMAGFECSTHRRRDGTRLDLIRATGHDAHVANDYRQCSDIGISTIRDGVRWHLIEAAPGAYDWSSWMPMLESAAATGVQVIWDMLHYGSPDWIDQGHPEFVQAYARFAAEAVRVHRKVTGTAPILCPINEISFFTWAAKNGYFQTEAPSAPGVFKRHLVRAAITGVEAMREVDPDCRFVTAEPLIHIAPPPHAGDGERRAAEEQRQGQFEACDMLMGLSEPELGGRPELIDAIGLNFYPDNQWYLNGSTIPLGHHDYRPLADMLVEVSRRYGKPVFLSETGAEGSARPAWLNYVCAEIREAVARGVAFSGICIYPVTAYPGWDNERHAQVGLFTTSHSDGTRGVYEPILKELQLQRTLFGTLSPAVEAAPLAPLC
jgi:beta-glucosidase/6-phospho-beta-glucosidase/beta-galactosidase